MVEQWLYADNIAEHLGVSEDTTYTLSSDENMPAHKVGRLWKFQPSESEEPMRPDGAAKEGA